MKERMDMEQQPVAAPEEEIDLIELAKKMWNERKLIIKWCAVAAVVALVAGFSIPKEYTTTIKLAPELREAKSGGNLGALAAMAGINLNNGGADAVNPELYPDVVSSVPFLVELFDFEVTDEEGELHATLYDYLNDHTRSPWWKAVIRAPFKLLRWFVSLFEDKPADAGGGVDTFRLTKTQNQVVRKLNERITVSVDKKTTVVTLSVMMQDPLISATVADKVMRNLQAYITKYRTDKARHDLEFTQKLYDEMQQNYYEAQQRYAKYMDQNQNIVLRSVRTEQERLQNEMNLIYGLYNQTAQQLQMAKAKVQESTPVYTVVNPATVPLKPSKPSKMLLLVGFVFLAGVMASAWVLFGRDIVQSFKEK